MAATPTPPACLMVQGCTSDAGKSTLVAALCRLLHRRGMAVAPFKPQNMALNSAVTVEGGEIGRAQAVQAQAAGLAPQIHMNPILLKPHSDQGCQVIVQGFAKASMDAFSYHGYKTSAMPYVLDSFQQLQHQYGFIVVEGAGSPAESKDVQVTGPDIAENGAVVPVGVSSTLPSVTMVAILIEKNPNALAASFTLPEGTLANVQTRVKMGQTSNVYALVKSGDKFFMATKEIKVTLGGCGG